MCQSLVRAPMNGKSVSGHTVILLSTLCIEKTYKEVMAVEMDWMRDWRNPTFLLNEPVIPAPLAGGRDDVKLWCVARVAIHDVLQYELVHIGSTPRTPTSF